MMTLVYVYYTLDMVLLPFFAKFIEMPIWNPTNEKNLNTLLAAQVDSDMKALSLFHAVFPLSNMYYFVFNTDLESP